MFYFLAEGSEGKSDYKFISSIISEFHTDQKYELHSSDGNRGLYLKFLDIAENFEFGDTFILLFDNIESTQGFNALGLVRMISNVCIEKGVSFRYSKYYCYEEVFLTYSGILKMSNIDKPFKDEVRLIQNKIMRKENYFEDVSLYWWKRYKHRSGVMRTRESLSSYIVSELTSRIKGDFKITKSNIGSCWISDCIDTTLHENVCAMCKYPSKNCTFREKLRDLDENSVSRLSSPFSTIFDTK